MGSESETRWVEGQPESDAVRPGAPGARIGLALGAGGPLGHAYHAAVLHALSDTLGFDARTAHSILGTSAGAQVGALVRAGMSPRDVAARASGRLMSPSGAEIAKHYIRPAQRLPDPTKPRRFAPSAPGYLLRSARRPWQLRAGLFVSALLPEGRVCLKAQATGLRRLFGHTWPERELLITAVHLESGEVVAFGAPGAPRTDVGTAVACSGAVPGVCAPMVVEGRRYVDGGMASATHLDLLGPRLDVAIVVSPLSMFRAMRWLLRVEVARLRARGTTVVVFEPEGKTLEAMGLNPMVMARSARVVDAAYETTRRLIDRKLAPVLRPFM